MKDQRKFATQTLIITLLFNTILLISVLLIAGGGVFGRALISIVIGAAITLGLWFVLQRIGRRFIARVAPDAAEAPSRPARGEVQAPAPDASALQLLAILQRKGRLIDFLQEDLGAYNDTQIGAAVRNIHEGCKQALDEYVDLEPVFEQAEGSTVTVQPGFDPHAIRLTGNIAGDPPFKGALRHRGWRVARVALPERVQEQAMIVAAAEVEVNG
jgi:hypothetical protein